MKVVYDPETDTLTIIFSEMPVAESMVPARWRDAIAMHQPDAHHAAALF